MTTDQASPILERFAQLCETLNRPPDIALTWLLKSAAENDARKLRETQEEVLRLERFGGDRTPCDHLPWLTVEETHHRPEEGDALASELASLERLRARHEFLRFVIQAIEKQGMEAWAKACAEHLAKGTWSAPAPVTIVQRKRS